MDIVNVKVCVRLFWSFTTRTDREGATSAVPISLSETVTLKKSLKMALSLARIGLLRPR